MTLRIYALLTDQGTEDVTDNDEAACRWCGRDRNENTR